MERPPPDLPLPKLDERLGEELRPVLGRLERVKDELLGRLEEVVFGLDEEEKPPNRPDECVELGRVAVPNEPARGGAAR